MILVTGGAGFIGSNLVGALIESGLDVCVSDYAVPADRWRNLARWSNEPSGDSGTEPAGRPPVWGRLTRISPEALDDLLSGHATEIDFVYHMGAITSTTETDVAKLTETNVRLPQSIWSWCAAHSVPLVYASSAATYGDGGQGFTDADDSASLARLEPLNAYGRSKAAFDRWAIGEVEAGRPTPPRWYGLKFFNVYGPNEYHKDEMRSVIAKTYDLASAGRPATLFRSHRPEYEDGGQLRDFIHVRDCVRVMEWLRAEEPHSGIYNVGTGRAQSWLELMTALYRAVDRPLAIDWVDTPEALRDRYQYFTEADIRKLRGAGYDQPFAPVEEGVRDYVTTYLATDDPYR